jgi:hypothetical protein
MRSLLDPNLLKYSRNIAKLSEGVRLIYYGDRAPEPDAYVFFSNSYFNLAILPNE